jgi:hypothetical protein
MKIDDVIKIIPFNGLTGEHYVNLRTLVYLRIAWRVTICPKDFGEDLILDADSKTHDFFLFSIHWFCIFNVLLK